MASLNPLPDGTLDVANATHLLRRCTFGPTMEQINSFASMSASDAVDSLFPASPDTLINPSAPIDTATGTPWVTDDPTDNGKPLKATGSNSEQGDLIGFYKAWHTDVMLQSDTTIVERLTWFFHTHLPARWTVINSSEAIYYQNCIFRYYSLRSFKDLFKKICVDNAMLRYLDGTTNVANNPNENFAREMFELYSIGKGEFVEDGNYTNYTEHDIKEATKVLTGWIFDEDFDNLDADHGWPTGKMTGTPAQATKHDVTEKTFSSIFEETSLQPTPVSGGYTTVEGAHNELSAMIDMIFDKDETAKFIVRKLYRFFVYHFISDEVENDIITPLAAALKIDYNIANVLKTLFKSQHFYDADDAVTDNNNIGAIIKSPVDLSLGLLRFFGVSTPNRDSDTVNFYNDFEKGVLPRFEEQGLNFYEPFEVAGYPAFHQMPGFGRNWVMPTELARRYQIGEVFMKRIGGEDDFSFHLDILDWVENSGHITNPGNAEEVVTFFTANLLAVKLNTDRYEYFLNDVFLDTLSTINWSNEWDDYFIDGGPNDVVKERLEYLVSKIIQTPEFQLL